VSRLVPLLLFNIRHVPSFPAIRCQIYTNDSSTSTRISVACEQNQILQTSAKRAFTKKHEFSRLNAPLTHDFYFVLNFTFQRQSAIFGAGDRPIIFWRADCGDNWEFLNRRTFGKIHGIPVDARRETFVVVLLPMWIALLFRYADSACGNDTSLIPTSLAALVERTYVEKECLPSHLTFRAPTIPGTTALSG